MSAYDHYAEARTIADLIEAEGFPDQAAAIRSAITDGSSGTEIFMQLRFYLAPLAGSVREVKTRSRIAVLQNRIDEALAR